MTREFLADRLIVKVYASREAMGKASAEAVAADISELLEFKETINVIFAAAPSQNEMLRNFRTQSLPWERINAFHMDEYVGLDKAAPQGFGNFLKEILFDHVPFRSVHYIDDTASDHSAEATRYSALLKEYPPDLVCMGIGENGHLAFNDPPVADFQDQQWVKLVELDETCRRQQVNDGCFASIDLVPTHALTLTIPTLMLGTKLHCMVPADSKKQAVYNTIHQEISEQYPSTILRAHANAVLYLDQNSSSLL